MTKCVVNARLDYKPITLFLEAERFSGATSSSREYTIPPPHTHTFKLFNT